MATRKEDNIISITLFWEDGDPINIDSDLKTTLKVVYSILEKQWEISRK